MVNIVSVDIDLNAITEKQAKTALRQLTYHLEKESESAFTKGLNRAGDAFNRVLNRNAAGFQKLLENAFSRAFVSSVKGTFAEISGGDKPAKGRAVAGSSAPASASLSLDPSIAKGFKDLSESLQVFNRELKKVSSKTSVFDPAIRVSGPSKDFFSKDVNTSFFKSLGIEDSASEKYAGLTKGVDAKALMDNKVFVSLFNRLRRLDDSVRELDITLDIASKNGLSRDEVLTKSQKQLIDEVDKSRDRLKKQISAVAAGVSPEAPVLTERGVIGRGFDSLKGRASDFMSSVPTVMFGVIGNAIGRVVGDIFEKFMSSNGRLREGFADAQKMFELQAFDLAPKTAARFIESMKEDIEHNPSIKLFFGENSFSALQQYKSAMPGARGGLFGAEAFYDPKGTIEKTLDDLTTLGVRANRARMSLEAFAQASAEGIRYLGLTKDQSESYVSMLREEERKRGLEQGTLLATTRGLVNQMRRFGHGMGEATGLAISFSEAVNKGVVSLQSVTEMVMAPHKAAEGTRAYIFEQMQGAGGAAGEIYSAIKQQVSNPAAIALLMKQMLEGRISGREIGLEKMSSYQVQRSVESFMQTLPGKLAGNMVSAGASDLERKSVEETLMRKLYSSLMGVDIQNMPEADIAAGRFVLNGGQFGRRLPSEKTAGEEKKDFERQREIMKDMISVAEVVKITAEKVFLETANLGRDAFMGKEGLELLSLGFSKGSKDSKEGGEDIIARVAGAAGEFNASTVSKANTYLDMIYEAASKAPRGSISEKEAQTVVVPLIALNSFISERLIRALYENDLESVGKIVTEYKKMNMGVAEKTLKKNQESFKNWTKIKNAMTGGGVPE